jgi:cellulose biosynthesis protein BcsQ
MKRQGYNRVIKGVICGKSVFIQKGGVGKTTAAVTLAAEIAWKMKSCLLVDFDPQGTATTWIAPEAIEFELADVLKEIDPAASVTAAQKKKLCRV